MSKHSAAAPRSLWIVPSRSRPTRLHAMLTAGLTLDDTADFHVCLDEDDPTLDGYALLRKGLDRKWPGRITWQAGPRDTMPSWTNRVAASAGAKAWGMFGSIGDDHLPGTDGWAAVLAAALHRAGIAYGDDKRQRERLPTYWLELRAVADALGWMCLPGITHYFADTAIGDLGPVYVPGSVAEHYHPAWGTAPADATYADAIGSFDTDKAVYEKWCAGQRAADRLTVATTVAREVTR